MGRHIAPRERKVGRLVVLLAAAGAALALIAAPLAAPASAQAVVQSHGGDAGPLDPGAAAMGAAPGPIGSATLDGQAIAALAWAQLGRGLDGPNTVNGADFGGSRALPSAWCAAFAGWAWSTGGVSTAGLNGWAGSFLDYGMSNRTFHTGAPRVGDAALFALSADVAQASASGTLVDSHRIEHVGIVVAVTATTVTVVNGDWGDGRGGAQLVRVSSYPRAASAAPDYAWAMRQYIAGYVDPVRR